MALTEADATARAEAEVRAFCGWHIAPEKVEQITLDGSGSPILLLPTLRVSDVSEVLEDGSLVDATTYEWSATGILRKGSTSSSATGGSRWTSAFRGVQVTLTHGYATMPLDLTAIIERLAARAVEGSTVLAQVGQVSYATGEDGLPAAASLTKLDRAVLSRYKLPPRP